MSYLSDYTYLLPEALIAHEPSLKRDNSRLMSVSISTGAIHHHQFNQLPDLLPANAILVLNTTKVMKARLKATRPSGGKAEIFLISPHPRGWNVLLKPTHKLMIGDKLTIAPNFFATLIQKANGATLSVVSFTTELPFEDAVDQYGEVPLPPYIHASNPQHWAERYQTVYAQHPGSVAAPTAGLHFTQDLLNQLQKKGIQIETLTLHVGYGTFKPIQTDNLDHHIMHEEHYSIDPKVAARLNQAKAEGKPIIAVGTTTTRALESAWRNGAIQPGAGATQLFIQPGYSFNVINGLITNFHLPKSTLLVLVAAFAQLSLVKKAYEEAISKGYRFFSFGDATLFLQ